MFSISGKQEEAEEGMYTQEISDTVMSAIEMEIELSETGDQKVKEHNKQSVEMQQELLETSIQSPERINSPSKEKFKASSDGEEFDVLKEFQEDGEEETEIDTTLMLDESFQDLEEKLEFSNMPKKSDSTDSTEKGQQGQSVVLSEDLDGTKDRKKEEHLDDPMEDIISGDIDLDTPAETKGEIIELENSDANEPTEEAIETTQETLNEILEASIDMGPSEYSESSVMTVKKNGESENIESLLELPKRVESPIEQKIEVSEREVQREKQIVTEEHKNDEHSQSRDSPKGIDSPLEMDLMLLDTEDASISQDSHEENIVEDKLESLEIQETSESPMTMEIDPVKTEDEPPVIPTEKSKELKENIVNFPEEAGSLSESEIEQFQADETSIIRSEVQEEIEEKEKEKDTVTLDAEETQVDEPTEESMEMMFEALQGIESITDLPVDTSKADDAVLGGKEQFNDAQETAEAVFPIETESGASETGDISLVLQEDEEPTEEIGHNEQEPPEELVGDPEIIDSPAEMESRTTNNIEELEPQDGKEISETEETIKSASEILKCTKSDTEMYVELTETEVESFSLELDENTGSIIDSEITVTKGEDDANSLETQTVIEEQKDAQLEVKEEVSSSYDCSIRTNSPLDMKIELFETEDISIVPLDLHEESKEIDEIKDKPESSSEAPDRIESPIGIEIKSAETEDESPIIPMEKLDDSKEIVEACDTPKRADSPLGMRLELSETGDASIVHSEVQSEIEEKEEDIVTLNTEETQADVPTEESMEMMFEALEKIDSFANSPANASQTDNAVLEENEQSNNAQETAEAIYPIETEICDIPLVLQEDEKPKEATECNEQEPPEVLMKVSEIIDSPAEVESRPTNNIEDLELQDNKEINETEETVKVVSEILKGTKSDTEMHVELTETEVETSSLVLNENSRYMEEKVEDASEVAKQSEDLVETEIESSKCDEDYSENLVQSDKREEGEKLDDQEDAVESNIVSESKAETTELEEAAIDSKESIETVTEISQDIESPIKVKLELQELDQTSVSTEMQDEPKEEGKSIVTSPKIEAPVTQLEEIIDERTNEILLQLDENLVSYNTPERENSPSETATRIEEDFSMNFCEDEVNSSETQTIVEEQDTQMQVKDKVTSSYDSPKRTNSPLGMKIKLFKTGDASIVPLDFHEESKEIDKMKEKAESSSEAPKRIESPIGMKIKLAKTKGGASIIPMEKLEDLKELVEACDTPKRTDSPLGMRIKLSKTGDASIIQSEVQDEKHAKAQDVGKSVEDPSEVLQKVESPIGMKIRLSKYGDASIISTEKEEYPEETKSVQEVVKKMESSIEAKIIKVSKSGDASEGNAHLETKEKLDISYGSPKRTNSPIGMKIKLLKGGDASIVPSSLTEEMKEACKTKDRLATSSEFPKRTESPIGMKFKLAKTKGGASIIPMESLDDPKENLEVPDICKRTESPLGMKIKLFKSGDASIVHSEVSDEGKESKQRDKMESKGKVELTHDTGKSSELKFTQEPEDEPIEMVSESWQKVESPIGMKIKLSKFGDASIIPTEKQEYQDETKVVQEVPKRTESPLGMKIRLSKTGDASIIQSEWPDHSEDHVQSRPKEKLDASYDSPKRTGSPLGMKIKLSRTGDASIVFLDLPEENKMKLKDKLESSPEIPKRTDSPIGMKIKLAKTKSGAAIISMDNPEDSKEKLEVSDIPKRTESPLGMKIKLFKSGDASIVHSEVADEAKDGKQKEKSDVNLDGGKLDSPMKMKIIKIGETQEERPTEELTETAPESWQKVESPIGMKIKLSKFGDATIIPVEKEDQPDEGKTVQDVPRRTESPLGMKIKLSKSGDASIIQSESMEDANKSLRTEAEHSKSVDSCLGMKIKLLKTGDASIVDPEKKERQQRRQDVESPLEMKIKLSKTGHPTIVTYDNQGEGSYKQKETSDAQNFAQRCKESALKILKGSHSSILQSSRSELTIEPVQMQAKKLENVIEISSKRKDICLAAIDAKKPKLDGQLSQTSLLLPEVTIQPVASREQKQFVFDPKTSPISLQQMNVISQEISITQVRPLKPSDGSMGDKLKDILSKNTTGSPMNSDCEIIEHRPELIIVNENSNSSQDVVIIEEVSPNRTPEVKKRRGRPRRNPLPQIVHAVQQHPLINRDPLSLEDVQQMSHSQIPHFESRENERPKRTCRSQKSYAPPRRGRGRGRGKRKLDNVDPQMTKKSRIEQDLSTIEASTTAVITIDDSNPQQSFGKSPELYKALKQPTLDSKMISPGKEKRMMGPKGDLMKNVHLAGALPSAAIISEMNKGTGIQLESLKIPAAASNESKDNLKGRKSDIISEKLQKSAAKSGTDDKGMDGTKSEGKDMLIPPGHPNWLTPVSKRSSENSGKHENVSVVQVIDEETRMSAESGSRSQTPARNLSAQASETIVNEESQGSVLSTATTESEKVKVKNRRMEINFDPDEGPFTVDKIAEYEWPLDRKGETFMIQEQISQYLGVKSFKRKYPDLKRRVVDMEERNYLRENGLVSEAMCDMGLTAICSSEVLDVMCSDFPDQYEEYRKHMREKQVKEHSKKQKELTAAANAEKNRIDLAEMAVQSALSWNISLNKARRDERKCSLDLQTFTIHVPKKPQKVEERKVGYYPVALIPGQYTDYYREYTPAELRYYPLNTVLYGPTRPNERKFDSQSEGSQSDNDSDSSSDDSSSSSSEGTQNTEGSQSTMDDVDMEIANQKEEVKLKCKMCLKSLNKHSKNEVLIQCGTCHGHVHPSCIDLTLDMVPHIQSYAWQCTDCKTCAQCHDPADEDKMLFCDMCDRGYHIYCVGLRRVPQGRWHCQECAVCANCASREPGGINSDRNSVAQWQHEYKKGDKNTRVYVSTLCVPCSKLRGDQGGGIRQEKLPV